MDRQGLLDVKASAVVDRVSKKVENSTQSLFAHRNPDGAAGIISIHASVETVGGCHGNAPNDVITKHLRNLSRDCGFAFVILYVNRVQNLGESVRRKLNIYDRPDYGNYLTCCHVSSCIYVRASAPPTTSRSSVVMAVCLALLYERVSVWIISPA